MADDAAAATPEDQQPDADDEFAPEPAGERLHGAPVAFSGAQRTVHPHRDGYLGVVEGLRNDGYWVCTDLCGVDYQGYAPARGLPAGVAPERFEVVANLLDPTTRQRIRIRVQVPESDPVVASLAALHPGVDFHERETWDLFGIHFDGHPHLARILMPDEWEGHPLRKDYAVGRIPVQFKAPGSAR